MKLAANLVAQTGEIRTTMACLSELIPLVSTVCIGFNAQFYASRSWTGVFGDSVYLYKLSIAKFLRSNFYVPPA